MKLGFVRWALLAALLLSSTITRPEDGTVGATCWSEVQVFKGGTNACRNADRQFYPGVLMTVAKATTVKRCQELNALDYGDGKCYPQCEARTYCLYGDNQ